jgi:hypothetical protein
MADNSKDSSQYLSTPIKDWYLDLLVGRTVPTRLSDRLIEIPPAFDQRPDLLSYHEYGTPKLWWTFSVRNPDVLIDPIGDFVAGLHIYVPTNTLK